MEYVENVMNLAQDGNSVNLVMLKDIRITLKIGLVEIKILIVNLYNIHNLMLYVIEIVLNGFLLKNFKISLILQEVLVMFIQLNGLKDISNIGILKIKNGIEMDLKNMH
jgi:hypothetical protein